MKAEFINRIAQAGIYLVTRRVAGFRAVSILLATAIIVACTLPMRLTGATPPSSSAGG